MDLEFSKWLSILAICFFVGPSISQEQKSNEKEPDVDYTIHPWRVWSSSSGKKTLYGQLDKIVDLKTVVIFDRDGKKLRIPIHKLSDKDIFVALLGDANGASVGEVLSDVDLMIDMVELHTDEEITQEGSVEEIKEITEIELSPFPEIVSIDIPSTDPQPKQENEVKPDPNEQERKRLAELKMKEEKRKRAAVAAKKKRSAELEKKAKELAAKRENKNAEKDKLFALMREWNKLRTWTDVSGEHSFKGTFVKIKDQSRVVLKNETGKEITVPLSKLSVNDIHVAFTGEIERPGGTRISGYATPFDSKWIPGKNKR